ncbi:putative oleosin [Helianthus annuus]|uniref:Oleosin n=1 Tax=Helianthus annuus TaxID=4232 RepID=A0A251URD4_HELAN|nr:oleosin G [Helianthus annuus]KAF5806609.1 putative oleosin [Helianthus annuus]KAJ0585206.1 putative oleosin [Helianthus annuus]KAJ0919691.1 putative oleosin [Helianthus annuus]
MTDRTTAGPLQLHRPPPFLHRLRHHSLNSTQLMGIMTLLISGAILLLLTGVTITVSLVGLIFCTPVIILTSPIWVPIGTLLFVVVAGFLLVCGSGVATVAAVAWLYKYFRGLHPVGSDRVDYARSRIVDTASHMKDYAREYGGYLQSKVKDAAPGA